MTSAMLNLSYEGSSLNAMKACAKSLGLGFATNEDDTDDKQVWISGHSKLEEYINKTVRRAWKNEKSFFSFLVLCF